ncbi:Pimeloyl-ACP methyl ester carboxylesterase [Reichenbachiella agariperforans]|uniref:Pimeloyl-ACP methyl ester carboxylesterase n=1 Tax=Reichenbachiella agariperforans TaxID=156994 RepID=A0A1M6RB24_REIAG|nr:alpha/beta hydrolase [Reichenbachiella agariperforans]SHK29636.1 Pimeloyl-ACP methyl ester carboxylesterase [Reichenbachiella agariperforans]
MKNLICQSKNPLTPWIAVLIGIFTALSSVSKAQDYSFRIDLSGQGQDILLIPGLTCDGAVWDATVSELQQNYTCHVITLPGFAEQPAIDVSEGFTPQMSSELIRYVQENQLNQPIVIGHSLGGFLALDMLSQEPELFSKAVIVDALPFLAKIQNPQATEESMKPAAKNMIAAQQNTPPEQYAEQQRMYLRSMITDEANIDTAMQWGAASDRSTVGQAMYDLYTTDLRDDIAQINKPVLVLGAYIAYLQYGVTKEMTLTNFQNQYSELKGVQISLSDKGKHFIMWDDPDFFMQQTTDFLSKQ